VRGGDETEATKEHPICISQTLIDLDHGYGIRKLGLFEVDDEVEDERM